MGRRYPSLLRFLFAGIIAVSLFCVPGFAQQPQKKESKPDKKTAAPRGGRESGEGEGDAVRRREEWFYRQRRFPLAHIPAGARDKALQRKEEMLRAEREANAGRAKASVDAKSAAAGRSAVAGPLAPSTTVWTPIGPLPTNTGSAVGNVSGRVNAIAVDPTNASVVYVGGAQGGVWKSTNGGTTWLPIFDANKSLAIGGIAIDPSNHNTIYVGTGEENFAQDTYYGAGIYKSIDGGATWTQTPGTIVNPPAGSTITSFIGPFNQIVGGVHVGAIVVHPMTSTRVYAAVQIFQNVDGGAQSGIYCSEDSGSSWTLVVGGAIGTDLAIHPNGSVGYAALGSPGGDAIAGTPADPTGQNGIYKTAMANTACSNQVPGQPGAWMPTTLQPVPQTSAGRIRLDLAPSDAMANTVYAMVADGTANSDTLTGIFKTVDGGGTWTNVTPKSGGSPIDICANQCFFDMVIKVHPNNSSVVFAGGSSKSPGGIPFFLIRSTDGGISWTGIAQDAALTKLHVDQHAIAFGFTGASVTSMYVGNDGGVWSTPLTVVPTSPVVWSNLNQTLQITQLYNGLAIDPTNSQIAFAGAQDNGTQKFDSAANGNVWTEQQVCGDGGYTAIDPVATGTIYAACEDINISKSLNGGADNFPLAADTGINQGDIHEFIPPLVIDPNPANPKTLYFGTFRVWQTTDGANSWTAISPDLTSGSNAANNFDISSLSVSPVDSNVVYAGTFDGRVSRTTQSSLGPGAIGLWVEIANGSLPPRAITQVAADPNNQAAVFVAMSGFSGFMINPPAVDTLGHVFKCSAIAPIGCTDISNGLPNIPVNTIVVDPADALSNTIYIGTDVGVFGTTNGGASWIADFPGGTNGFPNVAVFGLTLHPASRILRAATHGRGAWDLQLAAIPPTLASINPASGTQGQTISTVTLTGTNLSGATVNAINGVAVSNVVSSALQVTATFTIAANAPAGPQNVTVTTAGGTSGSVVFTVNLPPPPVLNSINPTGGVQGQTINSVTLNGMNLSGASIGALNGIAVTSVVVTATQVTATFTIAANAPLGPQNVTVTNNGGTSTAVMFTVFSDFTFGAANPASGTVSAPGNSTQTVIALTPGAGGFPGPVSLSCAGLPFEAACVFTPASPIPQSMGAVNVTVMITTRAPSAVPPMGNRRPRTEPLGLALWTLAALALFGLLVARPTHRRRRFAYSLGLVVILGGLAVSCGGGGGGGVVHDPGTPVGGPTMITITASSGGVSHASTFSLTVQ